MRPNSGETGQATVELALLLPVLALLLATLVEVGMIAADQTRLWHAAGEAARIAIVDPDRTAALAAAQRGGLVPIDMDIEPAVPERGAGRPLTVSLSYRPQGHVPLVGRLFGGVRLHAEATMRIEQP
ncbi:MAG: TadE/TadG family type IV pilus assembly protein [Actinomycetota bacterium]